MDGLSYAIQGFSETPPVRNEQVREYRESSAERTTLQKMLAQLSGDRVELPMVIGGKEVRTGNFESAIMPHNHKHVLGSAHLAEPAHITLAVEAASKARPAWARASWSDRAAVFLKAADLLSGPWRDRLNAATMLGRSKTVYQAEIDSAAELIDFLRFNVEFARHIYSEQPLSSSGVWNQVDYRPLEGFIYAATPFNFTAIAGNLPTAPALMGNTVVWKPSAKAKFSAHFLMALLREAGLPDGVINLVYADGAEAARQLLAEPTLAGVHFTGSTSVFRGMLRTIGERVDQYRTFPRVVGETGGKNFILAHVSADLEPLACAIIRGAFEYQGQKCSAASRIFVPQSLWYRLKERLCDEIATIRMCDVSDFRSFMGAVIDEQAWRKHAAIFQQARAQSGTEILAGGGGSMEHGYFIEPTLIETNDILSTLLTDEFFGPIATTFVYRDEDYEAIIDAIDLQSAYGLTGAVFARDRAAIARAALGLRNAAGNFYINDKPTGAVVGQQPFGGGRASGTNDKAGSVWNLVRWVSPRAIKETLVPPSDYRYPYMQ